MVAGWRSHQVSYRPAARRLRPAASRGGQEGPPFGASPRHAALSEGRGGARPGQSRHAASRRHAYGGLGGQPPGDPPRGRFASHRARDGALPRRALRGCRMGDGTGGRRCSGLGRQGPRARPSLGGRVAGQHGCARCVTGTSLLRSIDRGAPRRAARFFVIHIDSYCQTIRGRRQWARLAADDAPPWKSLVINHVCSSSVSSASTPAGGACPWRAPRRAR